MKILPILLCCWLSFSCAVSSATLGATLGAGAGAALGGPPGAMAGAATGYLLAKESYEELSGKDSSQDDNILPNIPGVPNIPNTEEIIKKGFRGWFIYGVTGFCVISLLLYLVYGPKKNRLSKQQKNTPSV